MPFHAGFAPLYAMGLGFCLDLLFGDPRWMPHPVRFIGLLIERAERILRKCFPSTKGGELAAGGLLVVLVAGISSALPWGVLTLLRGVSPLAALLLEGFWCYQLLAVKDLKVESMAVYRALSAGDLPAARRAVARIVGRDTQSLSAEGVTKAAVETVAENTSDGVVAPLLFMALGGAPLAFLYKAINTMDSMVGYKNDRYRYFGRAAAKLDDVANFLPARLAGVLMVASAYLLGMNGNGAWRIFWRDRYNHASPNSAQTEAACAGALGVQLAGNAYYFGKLVEKPTIGDPLRATIPEDIGRANRLLYATAALSLLVLGGCRLLILYVATLF